MIRYGEIFDRYGNVAVTLPSEGRWFRCKECGAEHNYLSDWPRCANEDCLSTMLEDCDAPDGVARPDRDIVVILSKGGRS